MSVARTAMNARFELLLHGADPVALRAAAEAALDEIDRLEAQLSCFRPTSEVSRLNRLAAAHPVRVSRPVFRLLQRAAELSRMTHGAFDPTVGPLLRCWGFHGARGEVPGPADLDAARAAVGMNLVEFDEEEGSVRFLRPEVMLDLGAIGKGFAIDGAVECLREAGVDSGFVHGGTSSCYGLGTPPDVPVWKAALRDPRPQPDGLHRPAPVTAWAEIILRDESLGVSAPWTKHFSRGGRVYGHVMDPRTGEPVERSGVAAVALPNAADSDALSTALLVLGRDGMPVIKGAHPEARLWWAEPVPGGVRVIER